MLSFWSFLCSGVRSLLRFVFCACNSHPPILEVFLYSVDSFLFMSVFTKCHWYFDRNYIESSNLPRWYEQFKNIDSSNPRTLDIFPLSCANSL